MRIAQLITDNREPYRQYANPIPWFGTAPEALLQGLAQITEARVHIVSCTQQPMASSPEKLAENIWFHSLHVPKIGWGRTGYQGCIRTVRKKLRQIRPDIVHGQGTERDCAISAVYSGFPNVVTIHGNMAELARFFGDPFGSFSWFAARLEDFTLPRAGGVLCNSAYTEQLVKPRTRRTWLVPNPIRLPFFSATGARTPGSCILMNVGAVIPRKRQIELLGMARKLHQRGCRFELRFVGSADPGTPYAARFLDEIRDAEHAGYARYLGTKNVSEMIELFDQASGAIHFPSEEAFGLVVAEALARNLKFFGADLGGIRDITQNIPGTELFAPNDWNALADALQAWIKNGFPKTPAADVMRDRYHPKLIAQRHIEIYREVLAARQ